ncbi:MAG: hypothetical protein FWF25_06460 [Propionibacteriaceae bacterium]|nr:hypothetical protein [Propionibacteriaceae bacterium]
MVNPLQLIPVKARMTVLLIALVVGAVAPVILPNLSGWVATTVSVIAAVMALFSNAQSLSNMTPDESNPAIVAKKTKGGTDQSQ